MTKPKPMSEMQRSNRRIGDLIRQDFRCPLCDQGAYKNKGVRIPIRVVAYRAGTVRVECPACGLRLSVDRDELLERLQGTRRGQEILNRDEGWEERNNSRRRWQRQHDREEREWEQQKRKN